MGVGIGIGVGIGTCTRIQYSGYHSVFHKPMNEVPQLLHLEMHRSKVPQHPVLLPTDHNAGSHLKKISYCPTFEHFEIRFEHCKTFEFCRKHDTMP